MNYVVVLRRFFVKKHIKFLSFIFAVVFLFSACGNGDENSSKGNTSSEISIFAEDISSELLVSKDSLGEKEESIDFIDKTESESSSKEDDSDVNKDFYILYTEDEVDFSKAPKAEIKYYPWNNDYTPYAYGQAVFKKDDGFYVFMYCEESNPKTEIKEIGGNVYLYSALEFFCDFRPEKQKGSAINYINLEMNSAGVYLSMYGKISVLKLSKERMRVKGEVFDDHWTVTAYIPLALIKNVYGDFEIGEGSIVECNFTKCGSGTEIKHWGTWQQLRGATPNFHQPKYFSKVEIRK